MAREIKGFKLDAPRGQVLREVQQVKKQRIRSQKQARQSQVSGERQESFIFGTLLNTTTYMIIFLLLLFGSSINVYQSSPQTYSWLDVNGEFKTSSYDITVSYNLDTPQDDLNGYSLREVFEEENLITNFSYSEQALQNVSVVNGVYSYEANSNFTEHYLQWNLYQANIQPQDLLYFNMSLDSLTNGEFLGIVWQLRTNGTYNPFRFVQTTGNLGYKSALEEVDFYYNSGGNFLVRYQLCTATTCLYAGNGEAVEYSNPHIINLTDLGINQTKDEMDYWYSEYQRLQDNRIEDMKILGGEVVSSWYTTTQTLRTIGEAIETIYENTPIAWIIDLFADIGI